MFKCTQGNDHGEQYYWQSNCMDGIKDCPNGEDEDANNQHCLKISLYFFNLVCKLVGNTFLWG